MNMKKVICAGVCALAMQSVWGSQEGTRASELLQGVQKLTEWYDLQQKADSLFSASEEEVKEFAKKFGPFVRKGLFRNMYLKEVEKKLEELKASQTASEARIRQNLERCEIALAALTRIPDIPADQAVVWKQVQGEFNTVKDEVEANFISLQEKFSLEYLMSINDDEIEDDILFDYDD